MPILGKSDKFDKPKQQAKLRDKVYELAKKHPKYFYVNGQTDSMKVSLTFDDGPNPKSTNKILNILEKSNIKATFFCVGKNVKRYPNLVKKIYTEKHWILNHSYSHKNFTKIDSTQVVAELQKTNAEINKILNYSPRWVRPPYGAIDQKSFQIIKSQNMGVVYWSVDAFDWLENPNFILNMMQDSVRQDDIILLHDKPKTAKILPQIIKILQNRGYKIVPLHELLDIEK